MLHDTPSELKRMQREFAAGIRAPYQAEAVAGAGRQAHFSPPDAGEIQHIPYAGPDRTEPACELIADFGSVELEYAAIRRGAGVLDSPHRGTLRVTGNINERRDFLNRMLTQELKDLTAGTAKSTFWLNRKGRIDADLFGIELGEEDGMWIDVDIHQAASAAKSLSDFIVMEDVRIEDVSSQFHHIAVHGKSADEALAAACGVAHAMFDQDRAATRMLGNVPVVIARRDHTGEPGFELIVPYHQAATVWQALIAIQNPESKIQNSPVRPIGWFAYNIARIEAGTPLFNIDFGPNNLPHESGALRERVSFTKGCYLGQEIVARMENLGKPKQSLVGLRMKDDLLPSAGEQVFSMNEDGSMKDEIGAVTSSTLSPMLSAAPIAFATVKTAHAAMGTKVIVNAEGNQTQATVSPLRFWPTDAREKADAKGAPS